MSVELPDDLAEALADRHGVYSDERCVDPVEPDGELEHVDDCGCRAFWVPALKQRMRDAVHAEDKLNA